MRFMSSPPPAFNQKFNKLLQGQHIQLVIRLLLIVVWTNYLLLSVHFSYQSIINGFKCHVGQDQYWLLFQVCTLMFQYCSKEKHVCFVNMCNSTTLIIRDSYILKYRANRSNFTALTQNISYMLPITAGYVQYVAASPSSEQSYMCS